MKKILLSALLAACIGFPVAGIAADAAAPPARSARVATGAKVPLVPSAQTPEQWSAQRPHFRDLRPKVRGSLD